MENLDDSLAAIVRSQKPLGTFGEVPEHPYRRTLLAVQDLIKAMQADAQAYTPMERMIVLGATEAVINVVELRGKRGM